MKKQSIFLALGMSDDLLLQILCKNIVQIWTNVYTRAMLQKWQVAPQECFILMAIYRCIWCLFCKTSKFQGQINFDENQILYHCPMTTHCVLKGCNEFLTTTQCSEGMQRIFNQVLASLLYNSLLSCNVGHKFHEKETEWIRSWACCYCVISW